MVVRNDSPTGTDARNASGASPVLDARLANESPRGSQPVNLGENISNLGLLLLSLYGMVDAVIGTFTVPQLKTLVRTLRRMGFKSSTVLTGRKSEIAESIRETAVGHQVTLKLAGPDLPDELVSEFAHYGVLGPSPGDRAIITNDDGGRRLVYDEAMLIQDGVSPDASDRRQWVETAYDASLDSEGPTSHGVKRGVMENSDRFTCNRNARFYAGDAKSPACVTRTGIPSCLPGEGRSTESGQIAPGYCPTCGRLATTPVLRRASTLNGKFVHAIIVMPSGRVPTRVHRYPRHESVDALRHPIMAKQCRRQGGRIWARVPAGYGTAGSDGFDYEEIEVGEWIGPALRPVHTQKVGGRYAAKIGGRTVWLSGSFVRVVYPSVSFGDLLVWAFFCNHDPADRRRYPDYDPARLNPAAGAVVDAAAHAGISTAQSVKESFDDARRAAGGSFACFTPGGLLVWVAFSAAAALVALMGRGTRRDRFGRTVPAGPGRPVKRRPCGCPTRQHDPACHHAGTRGETRGFGIDAARRAAARAAKALKARVSRINRRALALSGAPGFSNPGWISVKAAGIVYRHSAEGRRAFMFSRLSLCCACCGSESHHGFTLGVVSSADLRANADEVRRLCPDCWHLVAINTDRRLHAGTE